MKFRLCTYLGTGIELCSRKKTTTGMLPILWCSPWTEPAPGPWAGGLWATACSSWRGNDLWRGRRARASADARSPGWTPRAGSWRGCSCFRQCQQYKTEPVLWIRIRIRIGSGFNEVPVSVCGSWSKRQKRTTKIEKKLINFIFWSAWMFSFEGWRLLL